MGFAVRFRSPNSVLCDTEGWDVVGCGKRGSGGGGGAHLRLTRADARQKQHKIIKRSSSILQGKNEKTEACLESSTSVVLSLFVTKHWSHGIQVFRRWRQEGKVQDGSRARRLLLCAHLYCHCIRSTSDCQASDPRDWGPLL